jgi:H+/Na+-translocating ferredoxin:NAD+ oxidoreductase subunit G
VSARPPAALEPLPRGEVFRIAGSVTLFCVLGALILGAVYVATHRYEEASQAQSERTAITSLLGLGPGADVREIRQYLDPAADRVIYRLEPDASGHRGSQLVFTLDGALASQEALVASAKEKEKKLQPLGRLFVAYQGGRTAGYVVEGDTRGYKNPIRFFVALDPGFAIAGVRVVQHEEDPGLGAEVATAWFQGQYIGRSAAEMDTLTVTRDPMPEDWRAALVKLERVSAPQWRQELGNTPLIRRESGKPIYAVTGATISSRALTDGVRTTVRHFQRRFALLAPYLGS